jgi:PKD repeat protein
MRKLLFAAPLLVAIALACESKPAVGPGVVKITETTTSTSTSTTTTSTIADPTVAAFTFSPITPEVLQVVTFDASTSKPGTGRTIVSYSWDFGDGVTKTGIRTTHDYTPSGVYLITLTVTDDRGTKTVKSEPITVRPIVP